VIAAAIGHGRSAEPAAVLQIGGALQNRPHAVQRKPSVSIGIPATQHAADIRVIEGRSNFASEALTTRQVDDAKH
jgi:hypothetical protein